MTNNLYLLYRDRYLINICKNNNKPYKHKTSLTYSVKQVPKENTSNYYLYIININKSNTKQK